MVSFPPRIHATGNTHVNKICLIPCVQIMNHCWLIEVRELRHVIDLVELGRIDLVDIFRINLPLLLRAHYQRRVDGFLCC